MEERTKQALADLVEALKDEGRPFDLPDIPDFPDDFNTDDINRPSVHDFGSVTNNGRR